jgi:Predicted phosphoesterases, related to the Icc protein
MRILAVSDETSGYYYDYFVRGRLDEFDLILSCGDLKREYLEFLVTMAHCPLVYVRGNHDEGYTEAPPEGCECADGELLEIGGLRILGLGGAYEYRKGENMYSERKMKRRIRKLRRKLRKSGGFDILLTHAPARGLGDLDTLPHRGFECFLELLEEYRPRFHVHGHVHLNYGHGISRVMQYGETTVINACGHYAFDFER